MKILTRSLLALLLVSSHAWGYEKGWNYQNFYDEVDWCKQSIIFPTAQDFIQSGISSGKSEDEMSAEAISMVPVFESIGTDMCYCTFNELAKDISFSDYERGEVVKPYMDIPRCQNATKRALEAMRKDRGKGHLQ